MSGDPPVGTIALLFTDIEGSTRLEGDAFFAIWADPVAARAHELAGGAS